MHITVKAMRELDNKKRIKRLRYKLRANNWRKAKQLKDKYQ